MLICMIFLFTMCRKDLKVRSDTTGTYTSPRALTAYEWLFNTAGNLEGWTAGNATATVSGGALNLTTTGTDPLIMSPDNLNITAPATFKYIRVNMKNNSSVTTARIFFTTTTDTAWTQAKSKGFAIAPNNTYFANYIIDMSTVAGWSGTIRRIRIDPLDPAAGSGQTVNIDYIGISQAIPNINEWLFDTDGNTEGWTAGNATVAVDSGTLNVTTTSTDPLLLSPDGLGITAPTTYKFIHVDMKNNSPVTSGRIFFITDTDTAWTQAKSKSFAIKANTNYYASYIVDMSTVAGWTGTIRRIRVDPLDPATNPPGQTVNIDFIRITDNPTYRGVMSPQTGILATDADTLRLWKVNVMRWQIMSPTNLPATVADYTGWLNSEMTELDNAFNLCEPLGIKLLIDMHYTPFGAQHDSGNRIFYFKDANDKIIESWKTLATRYKDRSGLYGYDLINEPIQFKTPLTGCDVRTTYINIGNAIRTIDRKTPIFVAADPGDGPGTFTNFTPVPFTNVIYEVHMYDPMAYTMQLIPNTGFNTPYTYPGTINGSTVDKTALTADLDHVRTFQNNYNVRIHVGEFSAARWAGGAATYLRDCMDIFEGYGWSWTYHVYREAKTWSLEYEDLPVGDANAVRSAPPSYNDRYSQVVGYGLNLNQ